MITRNQLLSGAFLATAKDGVHSEPGDIEGTALEIWKRNGGKSMRAYFRYRGAQFNERRTMRIPLGRYDQGLRELRLKRASCEQLILEGKSPQRYQVQLEDQRRAAGMTLRQAMDEFWAHAEKALWNSQTAEYNARVREKHLDGLRIMGMPLDSVRAVHINEDIGEKWRTLSGIGPRMRSLIHSAIQYQIDKDDGVFRGPNPASWREKSSLSRKLGPQLPSRPCPGVHWEDVPKVFAYFCGPMDHWVPGYLTTMQAARTFNRDPKAIRDSHDKGHFKGVIKAPPIWKGSSNLIPIGELKKKYGEFVRTPEPHEQESARMNSKLMRFLMLNPVRASNACYLRWRNIDEDKENGIIEYKPKRRDPATREMLPSEHKNGWKFPVSYIAPLTDNLRALIEEQRQEQIREGIKIEPDGFVFRHSRCQTGSDHWFGKPSNHRTLDDYITKAISRLRAQGETVRIVPEGAKKATIHGHRGATFTTWAKKHGYSDDMINLTLGHIIPAILDSKTNRSYFHAVYLVEERREMMKHWERHCLSLVEPRINVVELSKRR
jgi:integrase